MTTTRNAGRIVGGLLIAQGIVSYVTNFALLRPVLAPPGWLVNAAPHAMEVSLSVALGILAGAIGLAIAITVLPVFKQFSERMALTFVAIGAVALTLAAVENGALMSMLSLSKAYVASGADPAAFDGLRGVVAASRNWAHFTHVTIGGVTLLVFYIALYRFALVPRVLAAIGLVACALQISSVTRPFFGGEVIFYLLAPLGLANLSVALWLLIKDFPARST